MSINKSLIKLFKVYISDDAKTSGDKLITNGIIALDRYNNPTNIVPIDVVDAAINNFGLSNIDLSKTFHKSLEKVVNTSYAELILEQVMHYISTYGTNFEISPYIPFERLNLNLDDCPSDGAFTIIREVSEDEAKKIIFDYLKTVKAPNESNHEDIVTILKYLNPKTVDDFASNEIKIMGYNLLGIVPTDPQDFLRYAIYLRCGSTMLIKNSATINSIKLGSSDEKIVSLFKKANLSKLAEIFFRYKELFLAFKSINEVAFIINKIRRLANKYHRPLSDLVLTNFSMLVKNGRIDDAKNVLRKASVADIVKVCNFALAARNDSIRSFNIRNGKTYIEDVIYHYDNVEEMLLISLLILAEKIDHKYTGKKFYIPSYINYACPISEKQFTGNIPWGTSVNTPEDAFTAAIYWENWKNANVDIDIHLIGSDKIFGWNAGYKKDADIIFSGDMTNSKNGAAEAYYFNKKNDNYVLTASEYSGEKGAEFKFVITNKKFNSKTSRNTPPVDIADAIIPPVKMTFSEDATNLTVGVFTKDKFYFYGGKCGMSCIPNTIEYKKYLDSIVNKLDNQLTLSKFIYAAGGEIIASLDGIENFDDVINLDPSVVTTKDLLSILNV